MANNPVIIYTDGACKPNPGIGGWAAIIQELNHKSEIFGSELKSTNNRMEITGVLKALQAVNEPRSIKLFSDSQYVVNTIGNWVNGHPLPLREGWIVSWSKSGWNSRYSKRGLLNLDLWQPLLIELQRHTKIAIEWVRGHADNEFNNRCDELAVVAREKLRMSLRVRIETT